MNLGKKGFVQGLLTNPLFILLAIAIVGIYLFSGGLLAIGFGDDFIIEDDFTLVDSAFITKNCDKELQGKGAFFTCESDNWLTKWQTDTSSDGNGASSSVGVVNNKLVLINNKEPTIFAQATYKKDLKNRDIKIKADWSAIDNGAVDGGVKILFNDKEAYSVSKSGFSQATTKVSGEFLLEAILDIENPDLYHIVVNGEEVSLIEISEKTLNVKIEPLGDSGTLKVNVDFIKSRAYFNCEVDSDEVVIRDRFTEGSSFTLTDLTFKPVKFCVDSYPAIKRSFTDKGVKADIMGQITKKLTTGQTISVGKDEIIEIYYIADYKEGMGEKCSLDSAYDTNKKKCTKVIDEEEDFIEIVNNVEFIKVGSDQTIFKNSVLIGVNELSSSAPEYKCEDEDESSSTPNPEPSCWETEVTYKDDKFKLTYGQEKLLDGIFNIKYLPNAQFKKGSLQEGWTNNFLLTIKKDFLELKPVEDDQYYALFGSEENVNFELNNLYDDFVEDQTGLQVKKTKKLLDQQESEQIALKFSSGKNNYFFDLDTNEYGKIEYEIIPFYKIGDEVFFDNEKIIRTYEIVDEIPEDVTFVTGSDLKEENFFTKMLNAIIDFFKGLFS